MAIPDKEKLYKKLEDLGEQRVRENLAMGVFASNKTPLINLWLSTQGAFSKGDYSDKGKGPG